jgi:phosphoglycerate kinase
MAYTFLKAQGHAVGKSLVEDDFLDTAKNFLAAAAKKGVNVILPVDHICADNFAEDAKPVTVDAIDIPENLMGMDIGPKTIELFANAVKTAKTVVWNGPMGVFENPILSKGTKSVAQAMADTDATTIIGGGDSAAAANQMGFHDKMSHISTGGGASLEFLEGKALPGVVAANDK